MPTPTTSEQRIELHNGWPKKVEFASELEFQKLLSKNGGLAPFKTAKLAEVATPTSAEYHRFVGSIIDGLDALPQRPDYLFDHCFRVIDAGAKLLTAKSKTTQAIQEAYLPIFSTNPATWTDIVRQLCDAMPKSSSDYIAKRLLDASVLRGTDPHAISTRAKKCLPVQFAEMTQRYAYTGTTNGKSVNDCGAYLRRLLKTNAPATSKSASASSYPNLDLTVQGNLLSDGFKLRLLMSLFLFTMRNERQHGSSVSPFRTSMSSLARYASYYYAMICAYTVCLGVISAREPTAISAQDILINVNNNLNMFRSFFGANAK